MPSIVNQIFLLQSEAYEEFSLVFDDGFIVPISAMACINQLIIMSANGVEPVSDRKIVYIFNYIVLNKGYL